MTLSTKGTALALIGFIAVCSMGCINYAGSDRRETYYEEDGGADSLRPDVADAPSARDTDSKEATPAPDLPPILDTAAAACTNPSRGFAGFTGVATTSPKVGERLVVYQIFADILTLGPEDHPFGKYSFSWPSYSFSRLPLTVGEPVTVVARGEYLGFENDRLLVLARSASVEYSWEVGRAHFVPLANIPDGPHFSSEFVCVSPTSCCGTPVLQPSHSLVASYEGLRIPIARSQTVRMGAWSVTNVGQLEGVGCDTACETPNNEASSAIVAFVFK